MEQADKSQAVSKGSMALLCGQGRSGIIVRVSGAMEKIEGFGTVDTGALVGLRWGSQADICGCKFTILEPSVMDRLESLRRKAQIVQPKDAALIILFCSIRAGSRVIEVGSGSGALTIALASFVSPGGRVFSYDKRADFLQVAKSNAERAGVAGSVEFRERDASAGLDESGVDAVVIDIPDPWTVIGHAHSALRPGGYAACYCPNYNQVEQTVRRLREAGFSGDRTVETLLRDIVVHDGGTRPSFEMLGHSGYVTVARKA